MNDKQNNRLYMFKTVRKVVNDNASIWTTLTAFATAFGLFDTAVTDIEDTAQQQDLDLKGIAEDKEKKQNDMIEKALSISQPMVAFANVTNNSTLRQEIDFSDSDLRKVRDTVSKERCQIVHDRANTNIASLGGYGVAAGDVTAFATLISDYDGTIAGPRSAIAVRKSFTTALDLKFKEATKLLTGQLDQLIVLFKNSNPQFVTDYENARIIVDLGGRVNTFSGTVPGNSTLNITDTANDDNDTYSITSVEGGGFRIGRGANSTDMGTQAAVNPGETIEKTALELGPSGNKYLNIENGNPDEVSYKVVRE